MAAISTSALTFSEIPSSDLLRSSSNGICGVPLKTIVTARLGAGMRGFTVLAKVIKGKSYEYPWPDEADPNVKGGILTHLSHFKPLNQKPKPVTLEFEKPLMALEKKIIDVRKMANETGLDFSDQILSLENKYHKALKDLYTHLTPIQRVNIARHPNRPTFLDHVFNITEKFVELHGDRQGYDDPAIVTGIGTIDGKRYMFIGHQKGRNTKENIQRNFGMPTPHGYRKALRMMYYADHHGFPIVTFIDTPGAYADLKSEELGQGEAIAHNLRTMFGLKVPIVSIVIGEGGSGGALAIGPEACAAILWKTAKASPKAAEKLKITATELCKLQIADGVIPEPLGGAHADSAWTSQQLKIAINEAMDELNKMDTEELLKHRMLKFRKIGGFQEGIPIDPKRKVNMKAKEEPIYGKTSEVELEAEIERLKQKIIKAGESSTISPTLDINEMIKKLTKEVDLEYSEAVESLGLKDRLVMLREEFAKAKNSKDQHINMTLKDKFEKLKNELDQGISTAPNYATLMNKLNMLKEMSYTKNLAEKNDKAMTFKQEINKKLKAVLNRPDLQGKIDALRAVAENGELNDELKAKIVSVKKEIEIELAGTLKSLNLDVEVKEQRVSEAFTDVKVKVEELNEEINKKIVNIVNSSDLKKQVEILKIMIAKAGKTPDEASKEKIEGLEQQIRHKLAEAMNASELKEKHEMLTKEVSRAAEAESSKDDITESDESRVEMNLAASRSYV